MERIRVLIAKLKEQAEQNASPSQMLVTVQMLQNELYQLQVNGNFTLGTSKVAVMLPKTVNISVSPEAMKKAEAKLKNSLWKWKMKLLLFIQKTERHLLKKQNPLIYYLTLYLRSPRSHISKV